MKHRHIVIHLPEYVWNTLEPAVRDSVESHLRDCPACRSKLAQVEAALSLLSPSNASDPGRAYWASVLPRIHERLAQPKRRMLPLWSIRFGLPAVALAMLAVVFFRAPRLPDASLDLKTMIEGVQRDDISAIVDEDVVAQVYAGGVSVEHGTIGESDRPVIRQLLDSSVADLVMDETQGDMALEGMSAADLDRIVLVMEKQVENVNQ